MTQFCDIIFIFFSTKNVHFLFAFAIVVFFSHFFLRLTDDHFCFTNSSLLNTTPHLFSTQNYLKHLYPITSPSRFKDGTRL